MLVNYQRNSLTSETHVLLCSKTNKRLPAAIPDAISAIVLWGGVVALPGLHGDSRAAGTRALAPRRPGGPAAVHRLRRRLTRHAR